MVSGLNQVRDKLMAKKVKINPPGRLSARSTAQLTSIKVQRLFQICDWNRKVKSRAFY